MTDNVCQQLSVPIISRATTSGEREEYIVNFLHHALPSSDTHVIQSELEKTFTFNKRKAKYTVADKPKKAKFLTARKRTLLGLNKLKRKTDLKYDDALALNELWLVYMKQMLGISDLASLPQRPIDTGWDIVGQQLLKADYHGAKVAVVRSKCPSLVGLEGIILQDTKSTFRIIAKDNIVRTIPKDAVMFKIFLGDVNLLLFGKELCVKSAERSVKKFKTAHMADL